MKNIEMQLKTVTCPSCIKKIENTLNKEDGVKAAKVYFNLSKVKGEFDSEKTNGENLVNLVEKLGFEVLEYDVY